MMQKTSTLLAAAGLVSLANAHGYITTPSPRMPGSAMSSACGQQVYNNQNSDRAGNVQGELQVASSQSDYNEEACHIWLCKGYQFDDNTDNVQSYTAGQNVDFVIDIIAPHTGVANVSIVDTATNTVIGSPLKEWTEGYASTETGVTEDETNFSVTIPEDLGSQCSEAGACVLQWYWFAESIDQTYESCVDFTVGGSGSGSGSGSSSSAAAAPSSTTEAAATTTTAAAATSTTEAAAQTTTTEEAKIPTTLSTATRPTETATETAKEEVAPSAIPTDGTSAEQLNWISSIIKAVYQYE
ncbi:lytic polysaccharide monooxygenase [Aspergillus undulatus]|uniref:lytic polysaccharide monooxygenase n=1 Tax=Aspergillus undulatus TaxID=1810928 RepID=UPI003CCCA8C3